MTLTRSVIRRHSVGAHVACVLGDVDLVRPLGLAGAPCAAVCGPGDPVRFSRFTETAIDRLDHWSDQEAFVDRLVEWARAQPAAPVLFYQTDGDLLLVSRHRDRLSEAFRFVLPDAALVEDLADKGRFQELAERLGLPVPPGRLLRASGSHEPALDLTFPLVVKPLSRQGLSAIEPHAKAIGVASPAELQMLWRRINAAGVDVIAQELVPGPETGIVSYHAYIDEGGHVAGEFTGVKIRTYPRRFGHTTALQITRSPEVSSQGRQLVEVLGLRGVVKIDYKRDDTGALTLLEVNPRFNLWHHAGARAGVNLPGLVYADLTGRPRPPAPPFREGVRWCHPWDDRWAAAEVGISAAAWVRWAARCETRSGASIDDPMPFVRGIVAPKVRRRLSRRQATPGASAGRRS